MKSNTIVKARIHPAIGVARVGNSEEWFIGPEVPDRAPYPEGGFKDEAGRLKRQAARFRVYGYDAQGRVVRELTLDEADITWTVHVANKKAAWYQFDTALDIPEAKPATLRNAHFTGEQRKQLVIDPGSRSISGRDQKGGSYRFDSGRFLGEPVYLGELRTDAQGHLVFLGGLGRSNSPFPSNTLTTFANNDGWHDDTSDGPVSARVVLKGSTEELPVDPAWVITAPPNYAPDIIGFVTLYDLLQDVAAQRWLPLPEKPSFTEHIQPLLARLVETQWVNKGFLAQFGWKAPLELLEPGYLARLSRPPDTSTDGHGSDPYKEDRVSLFNAFRSPAFKTMDRLALPPLYGDGMELTPENPRQWLSVTATQYKWLKQWAAGDFLEGPPLKPPPPLFDEVPLEKRPETLDKAALHYCLGGPFHPGCEVTWPMRHATLYAEPFRVRVRSPLEPEPDYGPTLDPAVAVGTNGPLYAQGPGDLTRWMAVPWQSDTSSCLSGYDASYDEYLPSFWPARVPNQVLTERSYQVVMDENRPMEERQQAFMERENWLRIFRQEYLMLINQFVTGFDKVGLVERRPGPADGAFPEVLYVETGVETGQQRAGVEALAMDKLAAERPRPAEKWRPRGLELSEKARSRRRGGR